MTGLGVLIFVVFVLIAIGLHEFGHFATAKSFGIKVDRFFIGFGPKLWSTKRGETEYGVSAFPLGGYVRIAGMNPLEEISPEDRPRTFKAKPAWQRAIVLAAGSVTHFIVALIIIGAILAIAGELDPDRPTTTLGTVGSTARQDTPSKRAGLEPGDRILSVAGAGVEKWSDVQEGIRSHPGQEVTIEFVRDGRTETRTATLDTCVRSADGEFDCEPPLPDGERIGFLGVSPRFVTVHRSVPAAFGKATKLIGVGMKDSILAFGRVFTPATFKRLFGAVLGTEERRPDDPSGLVGVGKVTGDLAREGDWAGIFSVIASFNIFIGVLNLMPLPPLDGGHLAVLGYEKATRRDVDMRKLLPVTAAVITILGTLFFLLLYLDIVNPISLTPR